MNLAVRRGLLVLVAVLVAQAAWILAVPPFRGVDEIDHAFRAAGVASGQWHLDEQAAHGRGLLVWVPADLVTAAHAQCVALPYMRHDNCNPVEQRGDRALVATGAAQYDPLFYWVIGSIAKPFHGASALYAMRVTAAVICALLLALGSGLLTFAGAGRWTTLGLVTAVTPQVLFSTSIAGPNGFEMSLGFVLWSSLLALEGSTRPRHERTLLAVAAGAATILCFLRELGPLWVLCIVASVMALRGLRSTWELIRRRRLAVAVGALAALAAVTYALLWRHVAAQFSVPADAVGVAIPEQWPQAFIVPRWMLQMEAAFPFRDVLAPLWTYPMAFLVIGFLVWAGVRRGGDSRRSRVLLAIVLIALVLPIGPSIYAMPTSGAIWQGRYELPFVIGILPACGLLLDRAAFAPVEGRRLVALGGLAIGVVNVACVVHVEQLELDRSVSAGDPGWVHLPLVALAVLMAAGCAVAALLFRYADPPPPAASAAPGTTTDELPVSSS